MKKNSIILLLAILICSCDKTQVSLPEFDVIPSTLTCKAGDAVDFSLSGNPDIITFYSGEPGFRYSAINRLVVKGKPNLVFSSFASTVGAQANSLKLLVSTDFSGVYEAANIAKAGWTDITNRAALSTGTDNTTSGAIDLSDISTEGKPVYFAFKKHDDNDPVKKPWAWIIRSFAINLLAADDNITYPITTLSTVGWKAVDVLNPTYLWTVSSTALTIGGGPVNTPENEDWVISSAVNLYTVKPDVGIAVKKVDVALDTYSYVFKTAGNYTVTFVARNVNASDQKDVVKTFNIVVQ